MTALYRHRGVRQFVGEGGCPEDDGAFDPKALEEVLQRLPLCGGG